MALESGEALLPTLKRLSAEMPSSVRRPLLKLIYASESQGVRAPLDCELSGELKSDLGRAVFSLITHGLRGEPVVSRLKELEDEIIRASMDAVDLFVQTLPIKALLPVFFLQFPAFLLILLGPILNAFIKEMQL